MHFVNPLYLIGLLAIAIPVIIHLFNFRRFKKVYFTNVRFLEELEVQTRKQSRLRNLLILLMRILAIALLVFAFAQPYIPFSENSQKLASKNVVSVFIDNSFSMEAAGTNGSLLDEAKKRGREVAAAYKSSDMFQLLSCDFEGRQQRLVTKDEFLKALDELKISPDVRTMTEIINRQSDMLRSASMGKKTAFIISDFQKSAYENMPAGQQYDFTTYLIPLKAETPGNVYIDSCWFSEPTQQPGKVSVLSARVWNKSSNDLEKIPLKLMVNGQQKSVTALDIKADGSIIAELPFASYETGPQNGLLQVTDYPVVYDDKFYFSFDVLPAISVLTVNGKGPNRFLDALFTGDSSVKFENANEKAIDYQRLHTFDLIILNEITDFSSGFTQELKRFAGDGGTLLMLPAANADVNVYNNFLVQLGSPIIKPIDTTRSKVISINTTNIIFKDVFESDPGSTKSGTITELPEVRKHFPFSASDANQGVALMKLLNGDALLYHSKTGDGQLFLSAVPFDESFSSFPKMALFVPVIYNIALVSHPVHNLYATIGDNKTIKVRIDVPGGDKTYKLHAAGSDLEVIPQCLRTGNTAGIFVGNLVNVADNYNLKAGDNLVSTLSYNYNRGESDLNCFDNDELQSILSQKHIGNIKLLNVSGKPINEEIARINSGLQLWKYCIWLALAFLLAEIILIRIWK